MAPSPISPAPDQITRHISQNSTNWISNDLALTADAPLTSANAIASATIHRPRKASAAEKVLEQLRQKGGSGIPSGMHSPRTSWMHFSQHKDDSGLPSASQSSATIPNSLGDSYSTVIGSATTTASVASVATTRAYPPSSPPTTTSRIYHERRSMDAGARDSRRSSFANPPITNPPPSPVMPKLTLTPSHTRGTRSPSTPMGINATTPYPKELLSLLDGEHHTDEVGIRLNVGWPQLEEWLVALGGGEGDGDFGEQVVIIYR